MAFPQPSYEYGRFLGSNTALFVGQAMTDIYMSDYFAAPVTATGRYYRVHSECTTLGFTFFCLEYTMTGGSANAVWSFAPGSIAQIGVHSTGSWMAPVDTYELPLSAAIVSGVVTLGYRLRWSHNATLRRTGTRPQGLFHYHEHHDRPRGNHLGDLILITGPPGRHHSLTAIKYGIQAQFFRQHVR